jgi:hypothetical protein
MGFITLGAAAAILLLAGTALSIAGRSARGLRSFVGSEVRVLARGAPLPASQGQPFRVESVMALGAGLNIHLRIEGETKRTLLKVAQPREVRITEGRLEIGGAAYVQWAGQRLKPAEADAAPALVIEQVRTH